jgi:farnesyl-diphosphate farnesyltransferase
MVGDIPDHLRAILKRVSRSFYLTLVVVPSSLRGPVGLAYLLARAADTIVDTRIIPRADRLHYLDLFREELQLPATSRLPEIAEVSTGPQQISAERELLLRHDRSLVNEGRR